MANPENKHTGLRIVTAGSIAALGVAGAAIGKTIIEELSKPKVSALEEQQPEGIAPSQKAFQDLVTVTPFPSPSPEPPKTPTPEVMTNCSIIPQEYCNKAEITPYTDTLGSYDLVVVHLPAKTTLKAPTTTTRFFTFEETSPPFSGPEANFTNENGVGISVMGNYRLLKEAPAMTKINVGESFGETNSKDPGNETTVVIRIAKRDPNTGKWFTPKNEVEKYFPKIYSKPASKAINYEGPIQGRFTYHYSGGPND